MTPKGESRMRNFIFFFPPSSRGPPVAKSNMYGRTQDNNRVETFYFNLISFDSRRKFLIPYDTWVFTEFLEIQKFYTLVYPPSQPAVNQHFAFLNKSWVILNIVSFYPKDWKILYDKISLRIPNWEPLLIFIFGLLGLNN